MVATITTPAAVVVGFQSEMPTANSKSELTVATRDLHVERSPATRI